VVCPKCGNNIIVDQNGIIIKKDINDTKNYKNDFKCVICGYKWNKLIKCIICEKEYEEKDLIKCTRCNERIMCDKCFKRLDSTCLVCYLNDIHKKIEAYMRSSKGRAEIEVMRARHRLSPEDLNKRFTI
jgi:hypothetical protein